MKKTFLTVLVLLAMVMGAFSIDISLGANADYSMVWDGVLANDAETTTKYSLVGFNGFLDLQYVLATVGVDFSTGDYTKVTELGSVKLDTKESFLNVRLLAKFPLDLRILKLYPMAGLQYSYNLNKEEGGIDVRDGLSREEIRDLNKTLVIAGVGVDVSLSKSFFIRATGLYGFKVSKSFDYANLVELAENIGGKYKEKGGMFNIGLGVGFML